MREATKKRQYDAFSDNGRLGSRVYRIRFITKTALSAMPFLRRAEMVKCTKFIITRVGQRDQGEDAGPVGEAFSHRRICPGACTTREVPLQAGARLQDS